MKVIARTDVMSHEEWLEARSKGIGGSDAGTILGVNPYKGVYSLWAEKTGRTPDVFKGNEATRLGQAFERPIAEQYAKQIADQNIAVVAWPVLLQGKDEWQLANVDFLLCYVTDYNAHDFELGKVNDYYGDDLPLGTRGILEIKTTGLVGRGNAEAWEDDQVPASYRAQGAHYANVTKISDVTFVCLIGGRGLVERQVRYTLAELDSLSNAENAFWQMVQGDVEPVAEGNDLDTLSALYPVSTETEAHIDEFMADVVEEYRQAKADLELAEERVKNLRASLEQAIGSASSALYNGDVLYTYKSTKDSETFDAKAFKEAHPDLAAQFTKTRSGYRVLKVK